ncbi:MAG: mechanosensitive ion channel family protein [Nitrosopumilus sp.]|nr:mechanosensitive ion channel family protein [Nitrosopumilus sp.]MDH3516432.1 mechanosensitive ion channel family protein [Nitrosopumilus sp.]MDH3565372.1 mechanosensitive ion channel family protein [Nitrosopumilus sp.]MDH5416914.1 mechanosensitive ion channel family protein [Nitrosopumilus sp.]MDH5553773.1 mechanosensitive ion channel family protein [Nitrosopumilus sp.]
MDILLVNFYYILLSIIIAITLFFIARYVIRKKMHNVTGTQKLLGIVSIFIIISEIIYLGTVLKLFEFAIEVITSIGVGMVILGIALQHQLKNIAAGIGVYFGSDINIGDSILIKETHGVIIELHLTKIIALTEDGGRIIIPNQKLAEDVVIVYNKKRRDIEN